MRLRVIVVDDEPLARAGLKMLLAEDRQVVDIFEARNGPEAVAMIADTRPDLVLLDVQMPLMDGFQVIETIGAEHMPAVVFVTAHDSYAMKAFEVNAIDYLLKPVQDERFRSALERAKSRLRNEPAGVNSGRMMSLLETIANPRKYLKRLAVRSPGKTIFVNVDDVDWMEAAENYVELHVGDKRHLLHVPLSTLEGSLDPSAFARIHRSVIVNLQRIRSLTPSTHGQYTIVLESGAQLQSGRSYSEAVRALTVNPF